MICILETASAITVNGYKVGWFDEVPWSDFNNSFFPELV